MRRESTSLGRPCRSSARRSSGRVAPELQDSSISGFAWSGLRVSQHCRAALLPIRVTPTETPSSRARTSDKHQEQCHYVADVRRPRLTVPDSRLHTRCRVCPNIPTWADGVDGIRLKTGRTTEAFDGLCVRQGDSSAIAQPSDQSRESGRRLRDGSPPPSAASRAGCDSSR